jgi:hypothetical protein
MVAEVSVLLRELVCIPIRSIIMHAGRPITSTVMAINSSINVNPAAGELTPWRRARLLSRGLSI